MSPSQFLQFGSWVMTWLGNGGFVLPRTLQDSEATMVLGRALSVQLSINCKRPRLPRQKSTSPTLFTFSLPCHQLALCLSQGKADGRLFSYRRRWQGTQAEAFLKADISQNLQVNQKPKELWVTRPEYKAYPLNIQQELGARRERILDGATRGKRGRKSEVVISENEEENPSTNTTNASCLRKTN